MSISREGRFVRGLVFALIVILAGMIWIKRDEFAPVGPGSRAPDYDVYSLSGDTINLTDYRGSVVVLNVWGTFCAPCVREMPSLERLHQELADEGLEIIAVSVDPGDNTAVEAFRDRFSLTFPLLRDPSSGIQQVYGVSGFPTTFIIDRKGRIRKRELGERSWDDPAIIAELRELLRS